MTCINVFKWGQIFLPCAWTETVSVACLYRSLLPIQTHPRTVTRKPMRRLGRKHLWSVCRWPRENCRSPKTLNRLHAHKVKFHWNKEQVLYRWKIELLSSTTHVELVGIHVGKRSRGYGCESDHSEGPCCVSRLSASFIRRCCNMNDHSSDFGLTFSHATEEEFSVSKGFLRLVKQSIHRG